MADLVAIEFSSEAKAEEVRQKLLDLQSEYLIELEDAVVAIKRLDRRVKLDQLFHPQQPARHTGRCGVLSSDSSS